MALMLTLLGAGGLAACTPYEAMPTSPYQWQRRQDEIAAREAERARACATMNKDTARYQRECRRPGETQ